MEGRTVCYILEKTTIMAFTQYELTQGTPQQKWIKNLPWVRFCSIVLTSQLKNITVISWGSVLLVEGTEVTGKT
jgi:hypothetical protein